jgi:2'-hydroxyisoflavone reductase
MNILIIGGSRFVGPYLIEYLAKNKHTVTVFNRGKISSVYSEDVKFIKGDRKDGFGISEQFDVVIDMCAYVADDTEKVFRTLRFDYLLHVSSVAVYENPKIFPVDETFPIGDWPALGDYNKGKVACEQVVIKSGKKYGMIRPVCILGPNNFCDREHFIYSRIKNGMPLVLPGTGLGMTQYVFVDEVARSIAALVETKREGTFNISGDESITVKAMVELMGQIVGKRPIITYNPDAVGDNYHEEEFPFDNETLIVTNDKIKKIGICFSPLADGLKRDYDSFYKDTT